LFADRFGLVGVAAFAGILVAGLVGVWLLPEELWVRMTSDPHAIAHQRAVAALNECLIDGNRLRVRLVQELPEGDVMQNETLAWQDRALATVVEHAPQYRTDLEVVRVRPRQRFRIGDRTLSDVQSAALLWFDADLETLHEILKELRQA
jgi:hypothetical protein